jgi:hypothetical protein
VAIVVPMAIRCRISVAATAIECVVAATIVAVVVADVVASIAEVETVVEATIVDGTEYALEAIVQAASETITGSGDPIVVDEVAIRRAFTTELAMIRCWPRRLVGALVCGIH